MSSDPIDIPDPLQTSVGPAAPPRRKRALTTKKRTVKPGAILADKPRKKGAAKVKTRPPEKPTIDPELLERLALCGKWVKHKNMVRWIIWHCMRATPQLSFMDDLTLWDRLGRWGSETRSIKSAEEISERHMALGQLQRLEMGVRAIETNPVRCGLMKSSANQTLKHVVLAWRSALEQHLQKNPQHLQTPDEFAGFEPMLNAEPEVHLGLLDKPSVAK